MNQHGYLDKAGEFIVRVEPRYDSWWTTSKNGSAGLRLTLIVDEGPEEGAKTEYTGWLTPAAEDRTITTFAKVFGIDIVNGDIDSLIGRRARVSVEMEEYDGKIRAKVAWLNPLEGGGGNTAPEPAKLDSILSRLRSKSKHITSKVLEESGLPAPENTRSRAPIADSDLPWPDGSGKAGSGVPY
jgi:hypothetical protein